MKYLIFVVFLICFISESKLVHAQADLLLEKEVVNLGKLNFNDSVFYELKYKNEGDEPLIITQAKVNCSCTTVSFSKLPLMPGNNEKLRIVLFANTKGRFLKDIYIYSNAYSSPTKISIKGLVK